MSTWPDDILLIQYPNLGSSPIERLNLLSAISVLFDKPTNSYTLVMLGLRLDQWNALTRWIGQGHGGHFWHLEAQSIQITRVCEKHVLIGTNQMLADFRNTMSKPLFFRQLLVEDIWLAAQRYVKSEVIEGSEVTND
ncbi:MAG TPA: hypothetical protein VEP90_28020 [Methylomirabilota bacterium]|nr:hypothetical protein [Methylomirabilota bacterium]